MPTPEPPAQRTWSAEEFNALVNDNGRPTRDDDRCVLAIGPDGAWQVATDDEIADCGLTPSAAPRLTARFAAKEAVIKLLAPGDRPTDAVPRWRSIEVRTAPNGAPSMILHDEAADQAAERGIHELSVSLAHAAGIGTATVVALAQTEQGRA